MKNGEKELPSAAMWKALAFVLRDDFVMLQSESSDLEAWRVRLQTRSGIRPPDPHKGEKLDENGKVVKRTVSG